VSSSSKCQASSAGLCFEHERPRSRRPRRHPVEESGRSSCGRRDHERTPAARRHPARVFDHAAPRCDPSGRLEEHRGGLPRRPSPRPSCRRPRLDERVMPASSRLGAVPLAETTPMGHRGAPARRAARARTERPRASLSSVGGSRRPSGWPPPTCSVCPARPPARPRGARCRGRQDVAHPSSATRRRQSAVVVAGERSRRRVGLRLEERGKARRPRLS